MAILFLKNKMTDKKEFIKSFEDMKDKAELQALSNLSLIEPLTDRQQERMMDLGKKLKILK